MNIAEVEYKVIKKIFDKKGRRYREDFPRSTHSIKYGKYKWIINGNETDHFCIANEKMIESYNSSVKKITKKITLKDYIVNNKKPLLHVTYTYEGKKY